MLDDSAERFGFGRAPRIIFRFPEEKLQWRTPWPQTCSNDPRDNSQICSRRRERV